MEDLEARREAAEPAAEGAGANAPAPTPAALAAGPAASTAMNLLAGLRALVLRAPGETRASVGHWLVLVVLGILITVMVDAREVGREGYVQWPALIDLLVQPALLLFLSWLAARLCGREADTLRVAIVLQAVWLPIVLIYELSRFLPEDVWGDPRGIGRYTLWLPLAWGALASLIALTRLLAPRRVWQLLVPGLCIGVFAAVGVMRESPRRLWDFPVDSATPDEAALRNPATESMLYGEADLLEDKLAAITPGRPGVPELFLVGFAGTGSQDVFREEVKKVDALFARRFGTIEHSVQLINNPASVGAEPIASVTALRRALDVVGQRMDREEDVLVLFMTSHGAADFHFQLELWPYQFDALTPDVLREALDHAGIVNRVLIVSACYSGGFVAPLAGPHTLVMSASRPDRNSHGCSQEADWTFFGRAYFAEALERTRDFEAAFAQARKTIAEREAAEKLTPSEPQISVGKDIVPKLRAVMRQLEAGG
ncbi:C13 family peptidase [Niveibacterium sp. SC-1]|uniref:C13 family peptidase n=1 Tax=Niveibacterium sp. SC-1 TaxID=3135646 RepID=UPI00311E3796